VNDKPVGMQVRKNFSGLLGCPFCAGMSRDITMQYPARADCHRYEDVLNAETQRAGYKEVVALDEDGRPSFNTLQNYAAAGAPLHFFIFDLLMLRGREVINEPLVKRRELIEKHVLPTLAEQIRYSPIL
jgi:ATP-dependent DNA ligase